MCALQKERGPERTHSACCRPRVWSVRLPHNMCPEVTNCACFRLQGIRGSGRAGGMQVNTDPNAPSSPRNSPDPCQNPMTSGVGFSGSAQPNGAGPMGHWGKGKGY
uniref:Uncharacterized protein n=1 Tax=Eutreptiella gymnastica TaxID=73025 RepID=A0A7S4FY75_9EUGL